GGRGDERALREVQRLPTPTRPRLACSAMTPPEPSGPAVPERTNRLAAIAANLSWSWNRNARALFRLLDPVLWRRTQHNPIELLRRVDPARLAASAADPAFLDLYDAVVTAAARDATSAGTWFATSHPQSVTRSIAYFCAEFGLHASVPIYSGGLGVLAGDQCKAASDLGVPLVGVGLFYTRGYSDQRLRLDGWQEDAEERFDVAATPLERVRGPKGDPCLATVRLSGRHVSVGAWRVMVGRVPIFLLDTDLAQNDPAARGLAHRLYARRPHPVVDHDRFHMPVAAIRLSARVNAVSRRHGEESRRIWAPLWPDRDVARVPIGHVTNGVHVATWMANRILTLFDSHFGPDWLAQVDDP